VHAGPIWMVRTMDKLDAGSDGGEGRIFPPQADMLTTLKLRISGIGKASKEPQTKFIIYFATRA
jgi:hypothetical protein